MNKSLVLDSSIINLKDKKAHFLEARTRKGRDTGIKEYSSVDIKKLNNEQSVLKL